MKKILLSFLSLFSPLLCSYSVKDLEQAIKKSDIDKVGILVKKIELSREDRLCLFNLANEMIEYRRSNCKMNHLKRPLWHKSLKEISAETGMYTLPAIGSTVLFLCSNLLGKLVYIMIRVFQSDLSNRILFLEERFHKGDDINLFEKTYASALDCYAEYVEYLNACVHKMNELRQINPYVKAALISVGIAAIAAGPLLWFVKRDLAQKQAADLDELYKNAIDIKQILYNLHV